MKSLRAGLAVLLPVTFAAACASVLGIQDGQLDTGDASVADAATDARADADTGTTVDGSTLDAPTGPDAPPDAAEAGASDGATGDAGCAGQTPVDAQGVFVSTAGADLFACGARATPCLTVQKGIARAQTLGVPNVYIAQGTYLGQVTLVAGVAVRGGWSAQWAPLCTPGASAAVVLGAPSTANTTIVAADLGGKATLQTLTVASKAATDVGAGESIYGIRATGGTTTLELDDVIVQTAAGGAGTPGAMGSSGSTGSAGGCPAQTGAPGDAGAVGAPGTATFVAAGFATTLGSTGGTGAAGYGGTAGGPGQCAIGLVNGMACFSMSSCPSPATTTYCGDAGLAGCAGAGGNGGDPGNGGGSSVAVYAWGAQVRCAGGAWHAGAGGAGGAGGPGGAGGDGAGGVPGAQVTFSASCRQTGGGCVPGNVGTADGGAPGGNGGTGGTGGVGGGGAGGWSCAYVTDGDASVTLSGTTLAVAEAGAGGPPNGPSGKAQMQCP